MYIQLMTRSGDNERQGERGNLFHNKEQTRFLIQIHLEIYFSWLMLIECFDGATQRMILNIY